MGCRIRRRQGRGGGGGRYCRQEMGGVGSMPEG